MLGWLATRWQVVLVALPFAASLAARLVNSATVFLLPAGANR
jgi:hypothetical protein